ncbi:MAG: dual specificity protein phosphatase family protein [Cyanobacteriota bacterium]|nr:dual specificity protein phosphatase family protein [Cyanobacteriota bacterium]
MEQQQASEPITQNLWWVIPEKLAGVRKPTAEEIFELQASGIQAIVSVMDDPSNLDLYQQANLTHLWVPIKGGTAPTQEQVQELETFINTQNTSGNAVAIHCTSGRRRTGTVLAAYLIRSGASAEDAIQTILTANPQIELRDAQINFLNELAK